MAKFHIKLKVQGFELEVDGTRDDLPVIRQAVTEQIAGLIGPATEMAGGEVVAPATLSGSTPAARAAAGNGTRVRKKTRSAGAGASGASASASEAAVDWRHDSAKYGTPAQSWKATDKAIWLLYVAAKEANVAELTNGQIVATLSKHFRGAGAVRPSNLSRDLTRLKTGQNGKLPLVSEDTVKTPSTWFLTDAGNAHAQSLVATAAGQTPQA